MPKDETKHAGTNVIYKGKDGKEAGPHYCVQVVGEKATIQAGKDAIEIPVADIVRPA
jgi:hypothetical protein